MIKDEIQSAEERMKKAMEALKRDFGTIRTGRATPALLDRVTVEYYGTETPLNQIAGVSAPEARMLTISPYDRGSIAAIEKALMKSDLGITPSNDGQMIRLTIPPLTEERRKALVKTVHSMVEEAKVSVRNIRRDAVHSIHKLTVDKQISEDEERRANSQIDDLAKKYTDEAAAIGKVKEHEVMEV
ncbi:MAG: ribosome recycling factor [Chloroflexota bacterium]|nr:ribosome recycling factor [Chloroflexota bacterium]